MKYKLLTTFLAALLLCCCLCLPAKAAEENDFSENATFQAFYSLTAYSRMCKGLSPFYVLDHGAGKKDGYKKTGSVDRVQDLIDSIVAFKKGDASLQGWIGSGLAENVTSGAEWYVITLSQSGNYDFSAYRQALLSYLHSIPDEKTSLQQYEMIGAPTVQKFALALIATGSQDPLIQIIADRPIADLPVMAQVYGLHLLNNGLKSASYTAEEVKAQLLAMQRQDGGWAITGQYGDVDVTAMVLQALAPHYNEPTVKAAADRAITLLSKRQNADGSFSSMGKVNCESTAQVIMALSDLRIDCATDARFIKNGKTPIDALRQFRLSDGSFSHFLPSTGSGENGKTSAGDPAKREQGGKTGSERSKESAEKPKTPEEPASGKTEETTQTEEEVRSDLPAEQEETASTNASLQTDEKAQNEKKSLGYKPILAAVLFVICASSAVVLFFLKKATRKNLLLIGAVFAFLTVFVFATKFETVKTHNQIEPKTNVIGTVTLSIRCDTVAGKGDPDFIPKDGCILKPTEFEIEPGDTVYDVLEEATKRFSLHMEKKGTDGMVYVAAISHLYELQFGEMSGWVYHVNGESPFVGCDNYTLSDGDTIEWMYTLDLGADVGNTFGEDE